MDEQIHTHPYDLDAARAFIAALTGSADTVVTFQTFVDGGWGDSDMRPAVVHSSLAEAWPRLCAAQEHGHGVFVMVNAGDGKGRSARNVVALRALFADDDYGTVTPAMLAELSPEIVVRSGHGMHYYWRLRPGELVEAFKAAQQKIAAKLGTDPAVCDTSRVMRLPGTFNLKDRSDPRPVLLLEVR